MIELIGYADFSRLRLAPFLAAEPALLADLVPRENWEFLGGIWLGEGLGFTDFLRLETMPDQLGCITLALQDLPEHVARAITAQLDLPLQRGMRTVEVNKLLGAPIAEHRFVSDRVTFDYDVGRAWPYHVGCTVHCDHGLLYIVMARKDVLSRCLD